MKVNAGMKSGDCPVKHSFFQTKICNKIMRRVIKLLNFVR